MIEEMKNKDGGWQANIEYFDCSDFSTCAEAKEVFFMCGSSSDIHYLDADNDGIPCERYQGSGLC